MDSARDRNTLEEVDAADLLQRVLDENDSLKADDVAAMEFICLACNATMRPIAIKPNMRRVPHFRLKGEHETGCDVAGYEQLVKKGLKHQVSTSAGFPVPYPSKLRLPTFREVTDTSKLQESITTRGRSTASNMYSEEGTGKKHNLTVTSIKRLVRHFVSFTHPKDRCLPLSVPEVVVSTYGQLFQKPRYQLGFRYNQARIYFGKLRYTGVSITDNLIRLPLTEGIWDKDKKKPIRTLFLEIDMSSWSKAQKAVLEREIWGCVTEIEQKRISEPKAQPWLFFLGKQNTEDDCKFRLLKDDYRLVCFHISTSLQEAYSTIATRVQIPEEVPETHVTEQSSEITHSWQEKSLIQQQFRLVEAENSNLTIPTDAVKPAHLFEQSAAYLYEEDFLTLASENPYKQIIRPKAKNRLSPQNQRHKTQRRKGRLSFLKKAITSLILGITKFLRLLKKRGN